MGMARTKNKSTNPILFWKPNQFPSSRFKDVEWELSTTDNANAEITDSTTDGTDPEVAEKLEYLRNRFRNDETEGFDCTSEPSGCGPCRD